MLTASIAIVVGILALGYSADEFVTSSANIAKLLAIPPLLIGMLVVGFGTSAPEIVVSAMAAIDGKPELALGNAYGSNIVNIGLILGLTAVISPIQVGSKVVRRELPMLFLITVASGVLILDDVVSQTDGWLLLAAFLAVILWSVWQNTGADSLSTDTSKELTAHPQSPRRAAIGLLGGLVLMVASSRLLVWGAVEIARALAVSELLIGLTIVAFGTSLPELAASLAAIKRNEHDLSLGNVVGSCMFNLLAVIGIAGVITPISVARQLLERDWPMVFGLTFFLWFVTTGIYGGKKVTRVEGAIMLVAYAVYTTLLIWNG